MWEVYAVKYAERPGRTRADSFLFDDQHDTAHDMDYYFWVLKRHDNVILVDTGYDEKEGENRRRPIRRSPVEALAPLNITPEQVTSIICTHLHYDHAGGLHFFPNATIHLQSQEMIYATGPCMCHSVLRMPFTKAHVFEVIDRLYAGKLAYHDGDSEIVEGVTVHKVGGHSRGLQVVRIRTESGYLVLASDASHYYENFLHNKLFPIVVDVENMLEGFKTLQTLASQRCLIVPGHDPLVMEYFPSHKAEFIRRLDVGPEQVCPL